MKLMKTSMLILMMAALVWAGSHSKFAQFVKQDPKEPVDFVNPHIGGTSHTLQPTRPTVQLPLSMVRILPKYSPGISDVYLASKIYGFYLNVPGHRQSPVSLIMALSGKRDIEDYKGSHFDHDFEKATPYFYAVLLEDENIIAEYSPTEHASMFRFESLDAKDMTVMLSFENNTRVNIIDDQTVSGYEEFMGMKQYFYIEFDQPIAEYTSNNTIRNNQITGEKIIFNSLFNKDVKARIGISYISEQQAKTNLNKEIDHWNFEPVKNDGRKKWNEVLGKINITGGSKDQQIVFYTSLYRCFERMVNINEYGQYYSHYDQQVHKDDRPFYVDDWVWDTYRSLHPLRMFLVPDAEQDMIHSYLQMYKQSGWLPTFPQVFGDMSAMIGQHQAALIADAYFKGLTNFDMDLAYEALKKNATQGTMIPWREGPATELDDFYRENGYFPALPPDAEETVEQVHHFENRQAVAVTLEHAYDDWCLSRLAKELNKDDDYRDFSKRAENYRNVFNPANGFMSPKNKQGEWIEPFDPKLSGGVGGRQYFAEMNSWTYTWFVPHDIESLMNLMGGRNAFINRLDRMFVTGPGKAKWRFLGQFPDMTGMVGQFCMGNEQSFHIPYYYSVAGQPWKAQKRLRQLTDAWFRNDVMGICGDEDGGGLSSWYVFTSLGFYPVCPGNPVYYIGTPVYEKAVVHMGNGKDLTIIAKDVSPQNKYIQSMTLNGKSWNKAWFAHKDVQNGGELIFQMGSRPNKAWGTK